MPVIDATNTRITVVQGEFYVCGDGEVVLTTILGSCVAACMHDPLAGVGGMNHFLLPGDDLAAGPAARHGVHAMEMLVNGLLQRGARRERLQAKLFGGARLVRGLTDIGNLNAEFAEHFVKRERIACAGGSLRGVHARRIEYRPVAGRARQFLLQGPGTAVFAEESRVKRVPAQSDGSVELFA